MRDGCDHIDAQWNEAVQLTMCASVGVSARMLVVPSSLGLELDASHLRLSLHRANRPSSSLNYLLLEVKNMSHPTWLSYTRAQGILSSLSLPLLQ